MADPFSSVPNRPPTPSEIEFFKKSNVPGYAAPDNSVVLNPNPPPGVNMDAIRKNEALRILMRTGKVPSPSFEVTDEQRSAFSGTPYAEDEQAMRETLAARVATGDPSAGAYTPEQRAYVNQIMALLKGDSPDVTDSARRRATIAHLIQESR